MDKQAARELVVRAGKELVNSGLIARTWGNVSCRVSEKQFVITPSGRAYETLLPDEIVTVNLDDLSYEGNIKPSSELGIHAEAYRLRPDINFIIHTHQHYASMVSAVGGNIQVQNKVLAEVIGPEVKCAGYGLPGTKKLRKKVAAVLENSAGNAVIMAKHGALCLGSDYDRAFLIARELEKACEQCICQRCLPMLDQRELNSNELANNLMKYFLASLNQKEQHIIQSFNSSRQGNTVTLNIGDNPIKVNLLTGLASEISSKLPPAAAIHLTVYKQRPDINYIIHSRQSEITAVSQAGITLKPLLDDLAQIAGTSIRSVPWSNDGMAGFAERAVKALKSRHAVVLNGNGALCCGADKSEAEAVQFILRKGCITYIAASLTGKVKPLAPLDCWLMRTVYLKNYSKMAHLSEKQI